MIRNFRTSLAAIAIVASLSSASAAQEVAPANAWVPPASYSDAATGENYDIVVGDPKAPVTIYEYASLTCPHCRAYQELAADEVQKKWIDTGKAKLVYRHFPLDQSALAAALTVQCLPADKRYAAVKLFFKHVDKWAQDPEGLITVLKDTYGKDFTFADGEDAKESLIACMNRKEFPQKALQAMLEAGQNGVNSTPYFIVDGEHVRGAQPAEKMGEIIQKHLDARGQ
ncbi:thioredoxin domain-containing protein [Sinorhizobium meliloti]|nr:thioredoxin domain-containing protein [Sinorhizobium meliloti]